MSSCGVVCMQERGPRHRRKASLAGPSGLQPQAAQPPAQHLPPPEQPQPSLASLQQPAAGEEVGSRGSVSPPQLNTTGPNALLAPGSGPARTEEVPTLSLCPEAWAGLWHSMSLLLWAQGSASGEVLAACGQHHSQAGVRESGRTSATFRTQALCPVSSCLWVPLFAGAP